METQVDLDRLQEMLDTAIEACWSVRSLLDATVRAHGRAVLEGGNGEEDKGDELGDNDPSSSRK